MASKKKAAGAGAIAAGQAVRDNEYVRRLIEDAELREELRSAFESARKAYGRIDGKGPQKAFEDKKVQRDVRQAAESLKSAADSLTGGSKKRRGGLGRLLMLVIVGGIVAMVVNEDVRKKVLDALFGAEEEYEYTSTTTPSPAAAPNGSETASVS